MQLKFKLADTDSPNQNGRSVLTNMRIIYSQPLVNRYMGRDYEQPTPPLELPSNVSGLLAELKADDLRKVSQYAVALAEYREREQCLQEGDDDSDEQPEHDSPEDVPSKATLTIKTINDNRYYYWQWREGDDIKSKYKGPVNPGR